MNSKPSSTPRARWIRRAVAVLAVGALAPVLASQDIASAQPKPAATTAPKAAAPTTAAPKTTAAAPPADKQAERDPKAIAALERMGAYLKTLPSFGVLSESSTEEVLPSGQKLQFIGTSNLHVKRPDRFRLDVDADKKQRQTFYDGKTLTQYAPRVKYYASIPAPATIKDTILMVEDKYDVDLPLVDLFRWGTESANLSEITSAIDVGPSKIDGAECDHYAFKQPGEDWQVWIQKGATPLPRRLVITTLDEPGQPQHSDRLTWDLKYKPNEDHFAFRPPTGAQKIGIVQAAVSE